MAIGGQSIDQRKLFTTGIKTINVQAQALYINSAGDFVDRGNGRVNVSWNDTIGQWVDTASQLVYDRREQQGGAKNSSHWLAFQGEDIGKMVEVGWIEDAQLKIKGWFKVDENGKIVVNLLEGKQFYSQWIIQNGAGSWSSILVQ